MAPHSSTLAWKIPWTEEPGGLQSMGSRRVRQDWSTSLSLFTFHFHALEKEMVTHSSVLAWRIPGMGELGGLPSMGSHRVRHDWSDLAAAAAANTFHLSVLTLPHLGTEYAHVWVSGRADKHFKQGNSKGSIIYGSFSTPFSSSNWSHFWKHIYHSIHLQMYVLW